MDMSSSNRAVCLNYISTPATDTSIWKKNYFLQKYQTILNKIAIVIYWLTFEKEDKDISFLNTLSFKS